MKESDIRIKTREILDAYWELTGYQVMPDIGNFLQLREQAVRELRALPGEVMGTVKLVSRTQAGVGIHESARFPVTPAGTASAGRPASAPSPSGAAPRDERDIGQDYIPETGREELEELERSGETGASDFDILRSIKDPWN